MIYEITDNKTQFIPLLLLADEQESMVMRYLNRGRMFVLDEDGVKAECVVTDEGNGILEIKNIAVLPEYQGRGYGRMLLSYIEKTFAHAFHTLQVGTGDSPLAIPFYEHYGFRRSHVVRNFFLENYDHPIVECGVQLRDMIYLKKHL